MSEPFVGEIRMFAGNFAPRGWAFCDGQLMAISENDALFSLVGTYYGGDGRTTFGLPDLRGRLPMHQGSTYRIGGKAGQEEVTLTASQLPSHRHALAAVGDQPGTQASPAGALPAQSFNVVPYLADAPTGSFNAAAVTDTGGSRAHSNVQPFQCVYFIISLFGIYPSRH